MRIKVCGLRESEDIRALASSRVDYMGFVFYEGSPRYARYALEPELLRGLPSTVKKVGVFVNETMETTLETVQQFGLDLVQLHGEETPEFCKAVRARVPVIKVFRIDPFFDFDAVTAEYVSACDFFLFDTAGSGYGGNGTRFDWDVLRSYTLPVPFFLSGGIAPQHVPDLLAVYHPQLAACDVNSRFERYPGQKNVQQVKAFVKSLKSNGHALPGY